MDMYIKMLYKLGVTRIIHNSSKGRVNHHILLKKGNNPVIPIYVPRTAWDSWVSNRRSGEFDRCRCGWGDWCISQIFKMRECGGLIGTKVECMCEEVGGLTRVGVGSLIGVIVGGVMGAYVASLTGARVGGLTGANVGRLTCDRVSGITGADVGRLISNIVGG